MTESCYLCGNALVDGDRVVPFPVRSYAPQDHGGYLLTGNEDRIVHAACLRGVA